MAREQTSAASPLRRLADAVLGFLAVRVLRAIRLFRSGTMAQRRRRA